MTSPDHNRIGGRESEGVESGRQTAENRVQENFHQLGPDPFGAREEEKAGGGNEGK